MNFTIVEGDLLDQEVDVIVNAWNRNIIPLAIGALGFWGEQLRHANARWG